MNIKDDFLTDLGENYEYVRRIIHNTIEVKKIDYSESTSTILGTIITTVLLSFVIFGIVVLLFVLGIVALANVLNSAMLAITIAIALLIIIAIALWTLRKILFVRPILKLLYKKLL